jgi:N4-gp56 family major capsid protein
MSYTLTNVAAITADLQTYFAKKLLVVAEPVMVFKQFGNQEPIPANSSETISFTQYAKLSLVSSALTEGTPPSNAALSNSAITASISQYGAFVVLTDLAELTPKHPVVQEALYLLGRQAGESIDRIIQTVVLAGTTVQYANGKSSRANLLATDVMTTTEIRKAVKTLEQNAAVPFDAVSLGDNNNGVSERSAFVLVVDPSVKADITTDTTFVTAASYSAVTKLFNNEIGSWFGTRVVVSNNMVTISSGTTVHTSLLIGRNAFAVSDLQTLSTYIEGPGSVADPLHQQRTLGWKTAFAVAILNQTFMLRVESGSAYN